ncbi:MAG: hypothetical protein WDO24_11235 [Pseudomonadota bacterium]
MACADRAQGRGADDRQLQLLVHARVLSHHGLAPDRDVEIVGLGPRYPRVVDLVADGELDGAIISEPNVSIGEAAGNFRVWLGLNSVDFVPSMQWSIVVANQTALETEPDLLGAVAARLPPQLSLRRRESRRMGRFRRRLFRDSPRRDGALDRARVRRSAFRRSDRPTGARRRAHPCSASSAASPAT